MYCVRTTLLMLLLTLVVKPLSAEVLVAEALIKVKGAGWEGTRITILPQFGEPYEIPMSSNRFELELGLQASYLIRAEHPDCITKEVFFDCRIPVLLESWDFEFPFEITLEKLQPGERSFTYAQPVGLVYFDTAQEDFAYTTDYSRIMNATSMVQMQVRMNERALSHPGAELGTAAQRLLSVSDQVPEAAPDRMDPIPTAALHPRTIATVVPYAELNSGPAINAIAIPESTDANDARSGKVEFPTSVPVRSLSISQHRPIAKQRSVVASTRAIHTPSTTSGECGTHLFECQPNKVIVIDRVPALDGCVELRKVVHSYGEVHFFHDGRAVTEHMYNEVLTAGRVE